MSELVLVLSSIFLTLGCVTLFHTLQGLKQTKQLQTTFKGELQALAELHNSVTAEHTALKKDVSDLQMVNSLKKRGSE